MPRMIETDSRTAAMVMGVNRVLVNRGVFGLTLRAIAAESGISTGSLLHHFGSKEQVLRVAAHRSGLALVHEIGSGVLGIGVDAFLPGDDEMALLTRAWLAWCELWRSEPWLSETVGAIRARELTILAEVHEHRLSRPDLDTISAPVRPMPVDRARELLRAISTAALERSG
jgi:AcrR family transcriptional regulator